MSLFTGKGDGGTTKIIGSTERFSKNSFISEALGNLDELNSFLGLVKVKGEGEKDLGGEKFADVIQNAQECIFIISAGLAGSDKRVSEEKVKHIEVLIAEAEKELPEIKAFTVVGGSELSAHLDFSRTLARRAERRVVAVKDSGVEITAETLKYLNRLSSLLFALARLVNARRGIKESSPSYN